MLSEATRTPSEQTNPSATVMSPRKSGINGECWICLVHLAEEASKRSGAHVRPDGLNEGSFVRAYLIGEFLDQALAGWGGPVTHVTPSRERLLIEQAAGTELLDRTSHIR